MVSGAGPDPDPAMFLFGAAALHIAFPVSLRGDLADTRGGGFEPHPPHSGGGELLIDGATLLRIQVLGFADYCFSDPLVQSSPASSWL